jgi:hypothetical protein
MRHSTSGEHGETATGRAAWDWSVGFALAAIALLAAVLPIHKTQAFLPRHPAPHRLCWRPGWEADARTLASALQFVLGLGAWSLPVATNQPPVAARFVSAPALRRAPHALPLY